MPAWKIVTNIAVNNEGPDEITAEYPKVTDDGQFIEFKDSQHKVVYMAASSLVVSVTRVRP